MLCGGGEVVRSSETTTDYHYHCDRAVLRFTPDLNDRSLCIQIGIKPNEDYTGRWYAPGIRELRLTDIPDLGDAHVYVSSYGTDVTFRVTSGDEEVRTWKLVPSSDRQNITLSQTVPYSSAAVASAAKKHSL